MSGRFPGAQDVEQFWKNIASGVKSIRFFSDEELLAAGVDPAVLQDPNYVKAGTVLPDLGMFDASFFGYSPNDGPTTSSFSRVRLGSPGAGNLCNQQL